MYSEGHKKSQVGNSSSSLFCGLVLFFVLNICFQALGWYFLGKVAVKGWRHRARDGFSMVEGGPYLVPDKKKMWRECLMVELPAEPQNMWYKCSHLGNMCKPVTECPYSPACRLTWVWNMDNAGGAPGLRWLSFIHFCNSEFKSYHL